MVLDKSKLDRVEKEILDCGKWAESLHVLLTWLQTEK